MHICSASLCMSTDVFSIIFGNGIRSGCLNHYGKVDNACAVVHRVFFVGIIYILQLQCVLFQQFFKYFELVLNVQTVIASGITLFHCKIAESTSETD